MADYYVDDNGNVTTKKKKKKKKQADYIVDNSGKITEVKDESTDEDIAPAKTQKERTWFEKGALDDGFSLKNLGKTIGGTITDTAENLGAGLMGIGEKTVDALAWLGTAMAEGEYRSSGADLFQNEKVQKQNEEFFKEAKENTAKFIAKDLYNEEKIAKTIITNPARRYFNIDAETDSVFGEKTDSVIQSGGQLLGQVGLQAVGVPWFVTSGVTAFGSETENAFNQGATFDEAGASGLITAGAEILTEKISGGIKFGGKTLDDGLTNLLAKKISNKFVRTGLKLGLDAVGEGAEEWISEDISRFGQWLTYQDEETLKEMLFSEEAMDEKIEAFLGGAMLGGFSSTSNIAKSSINGVDYVSGLTANEQKVVDKEVENRIAEAKENGEKANKSKIYDDVIRDLDKGYISTDTIEEALGGDSYKAYKDTTDFESQQETTLNEQIKALEDEINTSTDNTTEQREKLSALRKQLENLKANSKQGELRKTLSESVYGIAKGSRLGESYNEIARRGQVFEADLSKYTEKEQAVIQKAIDSGILNNTNRTHEFVDMVAKISADKGVSFDFANNTKLKESGFAKDGVTINGFVTKDGITLNIDSAKALNRVTGHEISHVLEGTELYNAFQQTMFDYAKSKGDFDSRYNALKELYNGVEGANIEAELTADLVGDYLFTDADFVNHLSTKNRNVFEKIYDEIKYLCKVATAGSKEARELEKVKRAFEKAYKENGNTKTDTQYSLSDSNGRQISSEQQEFFKDSKVRDENGNLKVMYHGTSKGGHTVFDTFGSNYGLFGQGSYFTDSKNIAETYTKKGKGNNPQVYESYLNITNPIDMDAEADLTKWGEALTDVDFSNCKTNEDCYRAMEEYLKDEMYTKWEGAEFAIDTLMGMGYDGITHIGGGRVNADGERHRVYIAFLPEQIKNIDNTKPTDNPDIRYSLSSDSEGNKLTEGQKEYFKDSKAVDKDGNLLKVYHATKNDFTVFDKARKGEATEDANTYLGFFFTDDAEYMQNFPEFQNAKTEAYYLNMTNPIDMTNTSKGAFLDIVEVLGGDVDEASAVFDEELEAERNRAKLRGDNNISLSLGNLLDTLTGDFYYQDFIRELKPHYEELMSKGYDGVINYLDELYGAKEYIVLDSSQAKLTTNQNPTEKADIRYSLSKDSEGRELSENQSKYFKGSKIVDDNGNLKIMYHGSQETFTVFDPKKARSSGTYGKGFYFTDSTSHAKTYGNTYEVYLNITNPLQNGTNNITKEQLRKFVEALAENEDYGLENYGYGATVDSVTDSVYGKEDFAMLLDLNVSCVGDMVTAVKLFNEVNGTDYDGIVAPTETVAFYPNQIKSVTNQNPTDNLDINLSLSKEGEIAPTSRNDILGKDIKLETATEDVAPSQEQTPTQTDLPIADIPSEPSLYDLIAEKEDIEKRAYEEAKNGNAEEYKKLLDRHQVLTERIEAMQKEQKEAFDSISDEDAPPEIEAPYYPDDMESNIPDDPIEDRDLENVGNRKVKAYQYEHPEVKPFFRQYAEYMLSDLRNSVKGERKQREDGWLNEGWYGIKRQTTSEIATLLDSYHYTYAEIEKGINDIIEDNGAENNACSKRIELFLHDWLMNGYEVEGHFVPPNQEYINLLNAQQIDEYYKRLYDEGFATLENNMPEAKTVDDIVPTKATEEIASTVETEDKAPTQTTETERIAQERRSDPNAKEGSWWSRIKKKLNDAIALTGDKGWAIENLSKKTGNRDLEAKYDFMKNRTKGIAQEYISEKLLPIYESVLDSGKLAEFSDYARHLLNINRMSLDTEANITRRAELKRSLEGYTEKQIENIASETITRNTPKERVGLILNAQEYIELGGAKGKNKPVFGYSVTADISRQKARKLEAENPEFKEFEKAVLEYNKALRNYAVKKGLISQETADLWEKIYPYYVPIRRTDKNGASVDVPLDTNKTGVNNPFKRATGGNSDFEPLFETMAQNTEQIFRAVNRNSFGLELMETLEASNIIDATKSVDKKTRKAINEGKLPEGTKVKAHDRENIGVIQSFNSKTGKYSVFFKNQQGNTATVNLDANILTPIGVWDKTALSGEDVNPDDILDSVEENDGAVLKEGKNGIAPSFTVFVNGKRVEFDITEEIYDALKPTNKYLASTIPPAKFLADNYKKLLTEYDPTFSLWRNPLKDTKDVLFNSQHSLKTYLTAPETLKEIATKGKWYTEYVKNGGKTNTYYDIKAKAFTPKDNAFKKVVGFPLRAYSNATQKVEMFWRLSEYIASRKEGKSIETAMLDSARVTTNFGAGGDLTKWANRNGALFLNPSVQGAMQNIRNVREAYHKGLKGSVILASKVLATGLGGLFFNWLLWEDDEEYEELSDYVKQNYYIVYKTEDGKFVRIPKGRMEAVIQNGFEQMENLITGDDDVDMETFADLVKNNLAPNNPFENNLFSPIKQVKDNKTWYGDDLVPSRLKNVPEAEQFDETTDSISKWLGEKTNYSPYKINYMLQQYGGGLADVVLPYVTPKSESGENNLLAPVLDEVVTDGVLKNQNVSDFYSKVEELTVSGNSSKATDEDILKSKYINSVKDELGELYKQKREIQNGNLSDSEKYSAVRDIQKRINNIAKEGLSAYNDVNIDGVYATVGDRHYYINEDGQWQKISDRQLERQNEVTKELGITPNEYWSKTEISFLPRTDGEYEYAYNNPEKYAIAQAVGGYDAYKTYSSELGNIRADYENGKVVKDSRKAKVFEYIDNLDIEYGEKLILWKNEYNADDSFNNEIIEYLDSRDDISYDDAMTILEELGFTVDRSNGNISWD